MLKPALKNSRAIRTTLRWAGAFGFDPVRFALTVKGVPAFIRDLREYRRHATNGDAAKLRDLYPFLDDRFRSAGTASGHYFHQDLWAARQIYFRRPERHVDIGSRVDGFIAHLLVFRPVEIVDIRPPDNVSISGLSFIQEDATELKNFADGELESVSSLHAAEHFGLGRYGDPIAPAASFQFMRSLARVLSPGGNLYFSMPCGRERVEFNAHRILSPFRILDIFQGAGLRLSEFHAVKGDGRFWKNVSPEDLAKEEYGCGIFRFTK